MINEVAKNSVVRRYNLTECVYKRFYWRDMDCFYTYESSVPDELREENLPEEKSRFDILHRTTCFQQLGSTSTSDLLFEQVFQVGFGEVHSN